MLDVQIHVTDISLPFQKGRQKAQILILSHFLKPIITTFFVCLFVCLFIFIVTVSLH